MFLLKSVFLLLAAAFLSLPTWAGPAQPTEGDPFWGVNLASAEAGFDVLPDSSSSGYGFKIGVVYPKSRIYGSLDFYSWDEADSLVISAHYDRLFSLHPAVTAFAGVNASLTDFELNSRYDPKDFDTGPGFGAQAGLILQLSQRWALEAGVRADRFWVDARVRAEDQSLDAIGLESITLGYLSLVFTSLGP